MAHDTTQRNTGMACISITGQIVVEFWEGFWQAAFVHMAFSIEAGRFLSSLLRQIGPAFYFGGLSEDLMLLLLLLWDWERYVCKRNEWTESNQRMAF